MTTDVLGCPRCSTPLTRIRIGGISTDICEHCGGVWLDRLELPRFAQADSAFGDALVTHLSQFTVALIDHSIRPRCPHHPSTVMLRRAFSRSIPVQIDECPDCGGVWLDAGELAQIRRPSD